MAGNSCYNRTAEVGIRTDLVLPVTIYFHDTYHIMAHDSDICITTTSWVHASVGVSYNSTGSGRYRRCPHGQVVRPRFVISNNPCNRGGVHPSFPYLDDSVQSAPFVYINCITIYDRAIRYLWLLNGVAYVAISRLYTLVCLFVGLGNGTDLIHLNLQAFEWLDFVCHSILKMRFEHWKRPMTIIEVWIWWIKYLQSVSYSAPYSYTWRIIQYSFVTA